MLVQCSRKLAAIIISAALILTAWGQEKKQEWADRAEYDLVQNIAKEQNPQKKLELLNAWKEKYPKSAFALNRLQQYLILYQQMNQASKMLDAAKEIVAADPKDMNALYWISLLTINPLNLTTPEALDTAEKAANGILANLDTTFAPDKKPAAIGDDVWKKQRVAVEAQAHTTLGWVGMTRKNYDAAEQEFTKSLQVEPNNALVSQWMGQTILAEKKPEKQSQALYHYARAAVLDGPGALDANHRKQIDAFVTKSYTNFHGDANGLDQIKAQAKTQPVPPADFKIKSSAELAAEKEEEFKKSNPMLALWMSVKKELASPNGPQYFETSMKDTAFPGGAGGVAQFKGILISAKPAVNPKELVLGIADPKTPEVTLKLDSPLRGKPELGVEIGFEGIAEAFSPDPFNLTFKTEKDKITGYKSTAAPPAKKAAGAKKSTKKK